MQVLSVTRVSREEVGQLVCDVVNVQLAPSEYYFQIDIGRIWQRLNALGFDLSKGWEARHLADDIVASAYQGASVPEAEIGYNGLPIKVTVRIQSSTVGAAWQNDTFMWSLNGSAIIGPSCENLTSKGKLVPPEFEVVVTVLEDSRGKDDIEQRVHLLSAQLMSAFEQL